MKLTETILTKKTLFILFSSLVLVVLLLFFMADYAISSDDKHLDNNTPREVRKGLFIMPEAEGHMTDEQLQEFFDEYGEEVNVTVNRFGY